MKDLFLIIFLFLNLSVIAQNRPNYDELQKLEGMEYVGGITFYIEKKSQNLMAIQNGIIKWKVDVVGSCGKKNSKIKGVISYRDQNLKVLFGRNKTALVSIENGKIECLPKNKNRKRIKKEAVNVE